MFTEYGLNPLDIIQSSEWLQLRKLLSEKKKCFPVFSVSLTEPKKFSSFLYPRTTFPPYHWSHEEELLLMKATVIEPTVNETNCEDFLPSCRLFHVNDDYVSDTYPTLVCTDFPGAIKQRVFPWIDEAEIILDYLKKTSKITPKSLLNLFCGTGAIAISLSRMWSQASITCADINNRALQYAQFNHNLNRVEHDSTSSFSFIESDVFSNIQNTFDLIVGVPTMALQPPGEEDVEYLHSTGGSTGQSTIRKLLKECNRCLNPGGRLVFLSYGLGNEGGGEEKEPKELIRTLQKELPEGGWNISSLPNEKIWRVGDEKRFSNPMSVQYMISRLADPTYRANILGSYERWEKWIENDLIQKKGFSHLHFVIIEYQKPL